MQPTQAASFTSAGLPGSVSIAPTGQALPHRPQAVQASFRT